MTDATSTHATLKLLNDQFGKNWSVEETSYGIRLHTDDEGDHSFGEWHSAFMYLCGVGYAVRLQQEQPQYWQTDR